MMEKKYQLAAWTENVNDMEDSRLYMIPSVEFEIQAALIADLADCHREEYRNHCVINIDLARRTIKAYERMARFEILTGHYGDGIRYLFFAARYCIKEDSFNRTSRDNVSGRYSCLCRELRSEFTRLCKKALALAGKHRREDILLETRPKEILEFYYEHVPESRDCDRLVKKLS